MALRCTTTLKNTAPLSLSREGRVFEQIATDVLGSSSDLSVVCIGETFSKRLNSTYRNKDRSTNVLAFPLTRSSGEIYLDIPLARKEARHFDSSPLSHIHFLFIHGVLHLKGYDHGESMERLERRLMKKYFPKDAWAVEK